MVDNSLSWRCICALSDRSLSRYSFCWSLIRTSICFINYVTLSQLYVTIENRCYVPLQLQAHMMLVDFYETIKSQKNVRASPQSEPYTTHCYTTEQSTYPFLALLCRMFSILLSCLERVDIVNSCLATEG